MYRRVPRFPSKRLKPPAEARGLLNHLQPRRVPTSEGKTRRCCCDRGGRIVPSRAGLKISCWEHRFAVESHEKEKEKGSERKKAVAKREHLSGTPPIVFFRLRQTCTWESSSRCVSITQGEKMSELCWEAASKLWDWFPWNQLWARS